MRVRVELGLHLLGLRVAVVLLGLGSVALFNRMSPAIERILAENVVTLEATEQMLVALADPALEPDEASEQLEAGLKVARDNITEEGERPLIAEIERLAPRALAAPTGHARTRLVAQIRELAEINRASMQAQDDQARRLGLAGGWGVVIVALLILSLTMLLTRQLEGRVVAPLVALAGQAEKIRAGDVYLRCADTGAPEIREVSRLLNQLLDNQHAPRPPQRLARADRQLVLHFLDRRPGAWVAATDAGDLLACNKEALDRIEREGNPTPEQLIDLRKEDTCEVVEGAGLWLMRWPS